MKKRTLSGILLICMMCLLLAGCQSGSNSNVAYEARSGVVRVVALGIDGYYSFGSAFGVGYAGQKTDTFVTNHHVVNTYFYDDYGNRVDYPAISVWIMKNSGAWNPVTQLDTSQCIPCEVIYSQDDGYPDFAIIKAVEAPGDRVALPLQANEDSLREGDQLYVLGYPGTSDALDEDFYGGSRVAGVEDVTITSGVVSRFTTSATFGNTRVIQHDATINHGNSGGPLIDKNGAVVGINTYSFGMDPSNYNENINVSIRIQYVKDVLDDLRIHYDVLGSGGGGSFTTIGLAAAALVVIVVVAAVLMKRKPASVPAPGPAFTPTSGPVQPPAGPAVAGDSGLRIQGVSGQFAGRRFAIAGQLRIGRDPARNDLVYPADSQGVSGVHCVLIVEGGRLLVQDLGSTYGTFVGGNRLAANAPTELQVGDRFCLGSEREVFVVARKGAV